MKSKHFKWLGSILIIALLALSACSSKEKTLDIIANIDRSSIVQDGNKVSFNVKIDSKTVLRFYGENITVDEDGLTMSPSARLFSLDNLGQIQKVTVNGDNEAADLNLGYAYANEPSVESISQLHAAITPECLFLSGDVTGDLSYYKSGFLVLYGGNYEFHLSKLTLTYDSSFKQMTYDELDESSELGSLLQMYPVFTSELEDLRTLGEKKMEEEGSIRSDIIVGIDFSSIQTKGDTTFFQSVMSNGEAIRFEGKDISIDENGITMNPNSTITSLDSLGKIYLYGAQVQNAENYQLNESGRFDTNITVGYGYTYSKEKTSVDSAEEVHTFGYASNSLLDFDSGYELSMAEMEPNFVYILAESTKEESFVLTSLTVGYNPNEKVTAISNIMLNTHFTSAYLSGELYNKDLENPNDETYDFYLVLKPDTDVTEVQTDDSHICNNQVCFVPKKFYSIGDLKDASGNVLDKDTATIQAGSTLDITIGDYSLELELPVVEQYKTASTMNDLLPYAFKEAVGEYKSLVVPVVWKDQPEMATQENLELYKKTLGRIMDENGNVIEDYAGEPTDLSFSGYYDLASYGKLEMKSFITDWYEVDMSFEEFQSDDVDVTYAEEILKWVKETYPNLDMSQFDTDGNGYIDSMIIINAGKDETATEYGMASYSGALLVRRTAYGDYANTPEDPAINTFASINHSFIENEGAKVLIHEVAHNFGIVDYYDTSYSGIDAVGGFDMQSENVGDFNAYSKMALGWMTPQVVTGLSSGQSVELTLNALAIKEDAIVIPAKGEEYEGPFSEYIMIDLWSDLGVNQYGSKSFGLDGVTGVRISHVDARMEYRNEEVESKVFENEVKNYEIGTIHYSNDYNKKGFYNIEVIQSGKKNTFTNLSNPITHFCKDDFFYVGDTFTVEEYSDFFYNGKMDDGKDFGYRIEIVDIAENAEGNPIATIRITAE